MAKPVVRYREMYYVAIGHSAIVTPVDHPNHLKDHRISNTQPVHTSRVMDIGAPNEYGCPVFETMNTRYVPTAECRPFHTERNS